MRRLVKGSSYDEIIQGKNYILPMEKKEIKK